MLCIAHKLTAVNARVNFDQQTRSDVDRQYRALAELVNVSLIFFGAVMLLHLPSAEAISVRPNALPQKVEATEGYVNGCEVLQWLQSQNLVNDIDLCHSPKSLKNSLNPLFWHSRSFKVILYCILSTDMAMAS